MSLEQAGIMSEGWRDEGERNDEACSTYYTILTCRSRQVDSILWWKVFLRTSSSLPP